jgi:hypothetical protein
MNTGPKSRKVRGVLLAASGLLCVGSLSTWTAASTNTQTSSHTQKKTAKKPPLQPLPSGPTGPMQQIPLDSIAAVPPQVTYENNQLMIVAPNSTLSDILKAVRKLTGADIDVPSAPERVVTHLGPGPAREVVAELLNGSRFNYVILGSTTDDSAMTRIVLVARTGQDAMPNMQAGGQPPQGTPMANNGAPPAPPQPDGAEADAADENSPEENAEQSAEAETASPQDQPAKTPQQLMQEMQQRQMQLQQQQQQNPGAPPPPGRLGGPPQQ